MARTIDFTGVYKRMENAEWVTERIWDYYKSDNVKTVVVRFARSYFVFRVGENNLIAYPLSTTRYKWFNGQRDIYNFLVAKDIKKVWVFHGEVDYSEIRELVKNDEKARKHNGFWYMKVMS